MKRWLLRGLAALGLVYLAYLCCYRIPTLLHSRHQLHALINELRTEGFSIEPEPPNHPLEPDMTDATPVAEEIIRRFDDTEQCLSKSDWMDQFRNPGEGDNRDRVLAYLRGKASVMDLTRQLADMPRPCVSGFSNLKPLLRLKWLCSIFIVAARLEMLEGNRAQGMAWWRASVALARIARIDESYVSNSLQFAMRSCCLAGLNRIQRTHELTDEEWLAINPILADPRLRMDIGRCIRHEMEWECRLILYADRIFIGDSSFKLRDLWNWIVFVGFEQRDPYRQIMDMLQFHRTALPHVNVPYWRLPKDMHEQTKSPNSVWENICDSLRYMLSRRAALENDIRLARVTMALQSFRRRHDRYPSSLDEIAASLPDGVTIDAISGEPLQYRPYGGGVMLFSSTADMSKNYHVWCSGGRGAYWQSLAKQGSEAEQAAGLQQLHRLQDPEWQLKEFLNSPHADIRLCALEIACRHHLCRSVAQARDLGNDPDPRVREAWNHANSGRRPTTWSSPPPPRKSMPSSGKPKPPARPSPVRKH